MKISIKEITPSPSGEEVFILIKLFDGCKSATAKGEVAADFFLSLGLPVKLADEIEISREKYDEIEYLMKKTDAVKKGISLLSFAPNTKRALSQKLVMRGVSRDIAEDACLYLSECGYINEYEMAMGFISDLANRRLYGRARIKNELYAKGFESSAAQNAIDDSDIDFIKICEKRINQMGGKQIFADRSTRMKVVSSIIRYGFTTDEISRALRNISAQDES